MTEIFTNNLICILSNSSVSALCLQCDNQGSHWTCQLQQAVKGTAHTNHHDQKPQWTSTHFRAWISFTMHMHVFFFSQPRITSDSVPRRNESSKMHLRDQFSVINQSIIMWGWLIMTNKCVLFFQCSQPRILLHMFNHQISSPLVTSISSELLHSWRGPSLVRKTETHQNTRIRKCMIV